ncbi:fimbria/pilus outer membrane usher protein [Serratia sarumanii]|uniref:fimbria/pilus outer membrane usher protein n=1 Tax=Serratia sarumanii TaxID=3020826 RepID=UPI003F809C25
MKFTNHCNVYNIILIFSSIVISLKCTAQLVQNDPKNEAYFDPSFLNLTDTSTVDLTRFNNGANVIPGEYIVDIYVNGNLEDKNTVKFVSNADKSIDFLLKLDSIKKLNLNEGTLPKDFFSHITSTGEFVNLKKELPIVNADFDSGQQRLDVTIPQIYLKDSPRGYVNSELWDAGVAAAFLNYTINGYTYRSNGYDYNSAFGAFNAGVNLSGWYFRHDGNYNWNDKFGDDYSSVNTYIQRDIPSINSRIVFGQTSTKGRIFDTVPFSGASITHVEQMLPASQRGYAPDIRGVAKTNARVVVLQNDRIIYEKNVPPGPFQITDLFPTGYGGNLDVNIIEADGSKQIFQVPYASVSNLLRPGMDQFDIVVGKFNDKNISNKPNFFEVSYQRGLTNSLTGYTGLQASQHYYSAKMGVAVSTAVGAFSTDISHAKTTFSSYGEESQSGQSYNLNYSKYFKETSSNFRIAAYRYSTSGYMDYQTAMRSVNAVEKGFSLNAINRLKNKFSVTLNQELPYELGQIYLSGFTQNYWDKNTSDIQYQFGYNNNYEGLTYGINIGKIRNNWGDSETNVQLTVNVPLEIFGNNKTSQLAASMNKRSNGSFGQQVNLSGVLGDHNEYSYGVSAMNANQGQGGSIGLNGQYGTSFTRLSASYSKGNAYQNTSVGASGALLAYQGGLVMTPLIGNTFAIIEAPGALGAEVSGFSNITLDSRGHAALPYLTPYEMNDISINPKGMNYDVELQSTSQSVAPHEGAVVVLKYSTVNGYPLLIDAHKHDMLPIPFGAEVFDSKGNMVGNVGQSSQIHVRTHLKEDTLLIKWGESTSQQCKLHYHISNKEEFTQHSEIIKIKGRCLA